MNTRQAIVTLTLFFAGSLVAQMAPAADPAYKLLKKVDYAQLDSGPLSMEVFTPVGDSNHLGMIFVATGAGYLERGKISNRDEERIAETFCGRGYTLFVVRPGPTVKFSVLDMTDHVERAIKFIKENADQYRVDPDRLGMLSTAAGVHLVALASISADAQTAVKAAGVYFPPTDLRAKDAQDLYIQANDAAWRQVNRQAFPGGTGVLSTSAGDSFDAGAIDPQVKLPQVSPKAPPFLIVHGDADPMVGRGHSNLFFTAMRNSGIASDMVVKRPGGDPGPTIQAEIKTLANWFDKKLAQE